MRQTVAGPGQTGHPAFQQFQQTQQSMAPTHQAPITSKTVSAFHPSAQSTMTTDDTQGVANKKR